MSDIDDWNAEIERLIQMVKDRYGSRLTFEELEEVKNVLSTNLEGAAALRAIKLDMSDEPYPFFKPHKEDG
jgi:hypothetical protein